MVNLGSKNGTRVNGARADRRALRHGNTVTVGDVDLLFRSLPEVDNRGLPAPLATRALVFGTLAKLGGDAPAGGPRDEAAQAAGRLAILIEVAKLLPISEDVDALLRRSWISSSRSSTWTGARCS